MKRKLKPRYGNIILFLIMILSIGILVASLLINDDQTKEKTLPKKEEITEEIKEEVLEEDISILLPITKDKCDIDECINTYTKNKILEYFSKNNYEQINRNSSIYFKNASILIKIDENKENIETEEKTLNGEYNYYFNRYTTIDDLVKILNGQKINTYTGKPATDIAVLNYHFFYDQKNEKCNQSICLEITNFEKQLKYLKENNFKTLTIEEYRSWMYKEIDLPEKSVLLTIDDGAMGTSKINGNKLIPLLEKYELNATLFLITGWWKKENYESKYLDIQSHTHLMHDENQCSNKSRGAEILCSTKEQIINDLKKSITKVDNNISFCFPFYLYDNKSIEALQELDFKLAFIGGNKKSNQNNNKYKIPRYIIYKNTSLSSFKNMVN